MKRKLTILDKRGMTLTEMIVALGLLALLIAIFAPYFAQQLSMLVEAGQLNERAMENAYRLEQGLAENRISPDTRLVPVKYLSEDTERPPIRGWMIEEGEYSTFVAYDSYISNGPFALSEGYGPKDKNGNYSGDMRYILIRGSDTHFQNMSTQYRIRDKNGMSVEGAGVFADVINSYEAYIGLRTTGSGVLTASGSPYTIEIITPNVFQLPDGSRQDEVLYTQITIGLPFYLAAGDSGRVFVSCEPGYWISDTKFPSISNQIYASEYRKGMYVVGGQNGVIYYRTNDTNWQKAVTPQDKTNTIRDIIYSEEQSVYIAVGDGGQILRSNDGKNWLSVSSGTTKNLTGIAYGNNTFVVIGQGGVTLRSPDGLSWTVGPTINGGNDLTDITFKYNKFIAVGKPRKGTYLIYFDQYTSYLMYTDTGVTWSDIEVVTETFSKTFEFVSVGWDDSYFLIGQSNGRIRYSAGLRENNWWIFTLSWDEYNTGVSAPINDIDWFNGYFFAVTTGGRILYSQSGISNWQVINKGGGTLNTVSTW
ncbi:MAG: WD40/YVTN/BNR-like repeat-containing protein [Clostridia bacterium]|jgi:prepilin-type N-terminal cleavage/methylation domain-containing protein